MSPELFQEVEFEFTPGELAVFARPEPLSPSQWAERYLEVTRGPRPGPWRNDVVPYLPRVMDTWALPYVRRVVFCAAPQTAKSAAQYVCMLYAADRDPAGPMLLVMSEKDMAKAVMQESILPMIEASEHLRRLKSPRPRDIATSRIRFINNAYIYAVWATSAAKLATRSIEKIFYDECDKYPEFTGKEADPFSLAEARRRWYPDTFKEFLASSPTHENKYIWPALQRAQVVYCYEARCPHCQAHQLMRFKQIRWPKEARDPEVIAAEKLATYRCEACGGHWSDFERDLAVRAGRWAPYRWDSDAWDWRPIPEPTEPRVVAFHLAAWYSSLVSLSDCAAAFLQAKGDKAKMAGFVNNFEALPFKDWSQARQEDQILRLRDDRPEGEVPVEADLLIGTIDVQRDGFWYVIRAWQYGPEMNSWKVRSGFVESWEAIEKIMFADAYLDRRGRQYAVGFGLVDAGDGTRSREIYQWCADHPPFRPCKGRENQKDPINPTRLAGYPGLYLYNIQVRTYKDALARKLQIGPADPGAFLLDRDTTQQYAAHMCAEYCDDKGRWKCPPHKANHLWDCEVYNFAAADYQGVQYRRRRPRPAEPAAPAPKTPQRRARW